MNGKRYLCLIMLTTIFQEHHRATRSCSYSCGPWSACSVTCGSGNRKRTNGRACTDEKICTQPICPEITLTTQGIYQGSTIISSTVASTPFDTSSATERSKNSSARDTGDDLLPVKVAVPVGVCLFVAVILTVFLLKRRSQRQSTKDGENGNALTEFNNVPICVSDTRKAEVSASKVIDSDNDRSSTYDINPLYDSTNTETYYNHVRRKETDIFPEYASVDKRKMEHIETSNQNDYTMFNGVVGADKAKQDLH